MYAEFPKDRLQRIRGSWARLSKPQTKDGELFALRAFPH
jgi:hypothetical protein